VEMTQIIVRVILARLAWWKKQAEIYDYRRKNKPGV